MMLTISVEIKLLLLLNIIKEKWHGAESFFIILDIRLVLQHIAAYKIM